MQVRRVIYGGIMLAWLWGLFGVIPAQAALQPPLMLQSSPADDAGIDVVVVLDDSGSMSGECANCVASDPNNLRYSAAKLLLQLLDNNDKVAFVRFGDDARLIGSNGLQKAGSLSERRGVTRELRPPNAGEYDRNTYIDKGVKYAYEQLAKRSTTDRPGFILLLTDGKPSGSPEAQGREIQKILPDMKSRNIQVLPVRLCSPTSGGQDCDVQFLNNNFDSASTVESADELVRSFVSMYQIMKPGVQVVEPGNDGKISMNVRLAHGVRWFKVVGTPQNLSPLKQVNGTVRNAEKVDIDSNVRLDYYDFSDKMPTAQGSWSAGGTFVVVRTDTNVIMKFPPGNTDYTRIRYVSKDNVQLATFKINGPGVDEPLNINNSSKADVFVKPDERIAILPTGKQSVKLQLGDDQNELKLLDNYDIRVLDGAPSIKVRTEACEADASCEIIAQFTPTTNVTNIYAEVFLRNDQNVWQGPLQMECGADQCATSFTPKEGDIYNIYVLASALWNDKTRFGSVAKMEVETKSQLMVTGLTTPLDIINAPPEGWNITVNSPSSENLGELEAQLNVYDAQGQLASGVRAVIEGMQPISGRGEYTGVLKITGAEELLPGKYDGVLEWKVKIPSDKVNLPASVTVGSTKAAPTAKLETDNIRFPVLSVSAPVSVTEKLSFTFSNQQQFVISGAEVITHNCPTNKLTVSVQMLPQGGANLTLNTDTAITTFSSCSGQIKLTTVDRTAVIDPNVLNFEVVMPVADWQVVGGLVDDEKTPDLIVDNVNYFFGSTYEGTMLVQLNTYTPARYSSGVFTDSVGTVYDVSFALPTLADEPWFQNSAPVHVVPVTITRSCWLSFVCQMQLAETQSKAQITLYTDGITDATFAKQIPIIIRSRAFLDLEKPFNSRFLWFIVIAAIGLVLYLSGKNRGKAKKTGTKKLPIKIPGPPAGMTGQIPVPPGPPAGMTGRIPVPPGPPAGMTGQIPVPPRPPAGMTGQIPVPPGPPAGMTGQIPVPPRPPAGMTGQIPVPPRPPAGMTGQIPVPPGSQKKR